MATKKKTAAPTMAEVKRSINARDLVIWRIFRDYEGAREEVAKFVEKLTHDASGWTTCREFELSESAVMASARAQVLEQILHAVWTREGTDNPVTIEHIRAEATDNVSRGARWPSRSTSVMSNFVAQAKLAAWADLLDTLRYADEE